MPRAQQSKESAIITWFFTAPLDTARLVLGFAGAAIKARAAKAAGHKAPRVRLSATDEAREDLESRMTPPKKSHHKKAVAPSHHAHAAPPAKAKKSHHKKKAGGGNTAGRADEAELESYNMDINAR